jgi:peptidyl-prolyl cis-trans isomerase SurA
MQAQRSHALIALLLWAAACQPESGNAPVRFAGEPPGLTNGKLAAAHILIQWQGVERQQLSVVRSRDEARQLAQQLVQRARAGEDFAALAREYSDDPATARVGGELGVFLPQRMYAAFTRAAEKLHYGQISDPVPTRQGFQIILRRPVEQIRVRQLLVSYASAPQHPPGVERDIQEARRRADQALLRLRAGEDFGLLIREYSDAPDTAQGGEVGPFSRGDTIESFEQSAFGLEVGAYSDIVESIYGFHIIQRLE